MRYLIVSFVLISACWGQNIDYNQSIKNLPSISVRQFPYNAKGDGTTNDTAAITAAGNASTGKILIFPLGTYFCNNSTQTSLIVIKAAVVDARQATFKNCQFTTTGSTNGIIWDGGILDTSTLAYTGTPGNPLIQITQDHSKIINATFKYRLNYTAIQVGGNVTNLCPTDIIIENNHTSTNGESHYTIVCGSKIRISKNLLDGNTTNDGLNLDDGIALFGLSGVLEGVTIEGNTAENVYTLVKWTNTTSAITNTSVINNTCHKCITPFWIEATTFGAGPGSLISNINILNNTVDDLVGTNFVNYLYLYADNSPVTNVIFSNNSGYSRFNNTTGAQAWVRILGSNSGIYSNVSISNNVLIAPTSGGGALPASIILGQNNVAWSKFLINNNYTNDTTSAGINLGAVTFTNPDDLVIRGNTFANNQTSNTALNAHNVQNRVIWENNKETLAANQPELTSATLIGGKAYPYGYTYSELIANTQKFTPGTQVYCRDCYASNPITLGTIANGGAYCTLLPSFIFSCLQVALSNHTVAPTLSGCGAGAIVASATDRGGFIITGTAPVTACSVIYGTAFTNQIPVHVQILIPGAGPPVITRIDGTGGTAWTTGFTITGTGMQSTTFSWGADSSLP